MYCWPLGGVEENLLLGSMGESAM
uniref:Uncharacterized protein n=1 Tax=Anguilla anguilla TaxID=7936 RepID=A0A0E9W235_ANGAN